MPYIGLFFDIVIFAALAATIFFALRLSKQFERMQADRKAFETLIQALNVASSRAEAAIRSLKEAAMESGDRLQEKINAARGLSDEMGMMIEAGDSLAERLGNIAEKSRKAIMPDDTISSRSGSEGMAPRTRAEKELLDALKAKQK